MSINPLNDISRVYLEQVVAVEEGVRPTPVDKPLDKAAFKKRRRSLAGKEKSAEARKRGHEGKEWYNSGRTYSPDEAKSGRANMPDHERSTRHRSAVDPEAEDDNYSADITKNPKKLRKQKAMGELGEEFVDPEHGEAPSGRSPLQNVSDHPKASVRKKAVKGFRKQMEKEYGGKWKSRSNDPVKEAMDPVGQEDADIDNDGDADKSDKYLHKRRKAIGKAIATRKEALDPVGKEDEDIDNDGDTDKSDAYLKNRRKVRGAAIGKKKLKEGFSNWRQDLSEVMTDVEDNKKIKEKKVNNKVTINPKLGEAVEYLGGTLVEMIEFDSVLDDISDNELDFISDSMIEECVREVFYELLDEGYDIPEIENLICESIDNSLIILSEAEVTYGHDTENPTSKKRGEVLSKIKSAVKTVGKGLAKGAGYVAGAAVRGAKAAAREFGSGYSRGRGGSSSVPVARAGAGKVTHTSSSKASSEDDDESKEDEEKKPGVLSKIGSKLKKGIARGARAVSRGARNLARKLEGDKTEKTSSPKSAAKPEKESESESESESEKEEGRPAKRRKGGPSYSEVKADIEKREAAKKGKKSDKLDDLLASVRNEETEIDEAVKGSDTEMRKAASKERRSGDKRLAPSKGKGYADQQKQSISFHDKRSKGRHIPGFTYSEDMNYFDEKTLTPAETKKKEKIVKSMKDKAADFEKRYPGRGKEVMYATATKMAKKMAEQNLDEIAPLAVGALAAGALAAPALAKKFLKPTVDKALDNATNNPNRKLMTGGTVGQLNQAKKSAGMR